MTSRRIAYAYYDPNWDKRIHSIAQLVRNEVEPLDYQLVMKGNLICPQCYEPLIRVPSDPESSVMSDGRDALFRHLPTPDAPFCLLRSGAITGKRYSSEEEAKKAIEDEELIVIDGFIQERPENNPREPYDSDEEPFETHFESKDGRIVDVPVSRHNGQTFKLPSKITSVQSLCANFRNNYYREIFVVDETGHSNRYLFCDSLKDVNDIHNEVEIPNFYFGEITEINKHTNHSTVWLKLNTPKHYADFRVRVWNKFAEPRGIVSGRAENRIIVFYAPITSVGTGYWTKELNWGEVALLPDKYKDFLLTDYRHRT
ncbi:hypothetical protein [Photorhabdus caribbeanensis]|uniref:hypothetical protein n=1 Tax=Photorhabdus caribbeanensis TaxID=1004165 RepID=UPI001BD3E9CE|nr:hypothetical protein [Photorhabdus caribbeanensis]MBS9425982.1 hypothetical protein [Photorhabdus caribbeanensis]